MARRSSRVVIPGVVGDVVYVRTEGLSVIVMGRLQGCSAWTGWQ